MKEQFRVAWSFVRAANWPATATPEVLAVRMREAGICSAAALAAIEAFWLRGLSG